MKRAKKILAMFLTITMVVSFIPFNAFKVFAEEETYTVTFTVTEGTHTLETSGNTDLGINGNFLSLEATGRVKIGKFTKESDTKYILTVPKEQSGDLIFNNNKSYSLFVGENQISAGYHISGNTNIEIKNYVANTNPVGNNPGGNNPSGENNTPESITLQLDGATVSGNVITFQVDDNVITATVSGTGYSFNGNNLIVNYSDLNNVKLVLSNNFDSSRMQLKLHNGQTLIVTGNGEAIFDGLDFSQDNSPHLGLYLENNGGGQGGNNTQEYQGNETATLNYSVNGVVEYEAGPFEGLGINFRINEISYRPDSGKINYTEDTAYERDENGQIIKNENEEPIPMLDPNTMQPMIEKTGVTITGDTIHYDSDGEKVKFVFMMNPGTLMTGLKINGATINNLPKTKEELANCYTDHRIEIEVDNIDKADTYNIEIEARYPNSSEEFMGNFLWDYNPKGYTGPEDKILNATLTFVEAEYNGVKYTTEEEINALGGIYNWRDAERKKVYTEEREGCGEAQFPTGTKLTVKIIPDAGYQLVDFGINGGVFDPQEEIGTYTFEVKGGPFHLQATIAQVEDVVKTKSEKVESGSITLGGEENSMLIGTARLDVNDVDLTKEQINNFEEAAEGYDIKSYIDISLFNTVFKGKETESWDTQVNNLDNEATITLKLEDGVDGNEVVIVHEKHDGTYEIIPTTYDAQTNTITFKTKSFSNYAIASKVEATTANDAQENKASTINNPLTGDNIITIVTVLVIATLGVLTTNKFNKRKVGKHFNK